MSTPDTEIENMVVEQVTTFEDDRSLVDTNIPAAVSIINNLDQILEARKHSIIDILSRPHQLPIPGTEDFSFAWNSDHPPTNDIITPAEYAVFPFVPKGLLTAFDFPDAIYTSNIIDKLSNFLFFKANIEVSIRVNATVFQQGRLFVAFSPYSDKIPAERNNLNEHRRAISNFPGVEVDAGSGSIGVVRVPYCSPLEAYPLTTASGDMGSMRIYCQNKLQGPTSREEVYITVFARFTDIVLEIPTISAPTLRLNISRKLALIKSFTAKILECKDIEAVEALRVLQSKQNPRTGNVKSQGGTGETQATAGGVVSNLANAVADVADVATGWPILASFAAPVSWFARLIAGVASFFGWSRPLNQEIPAIFANMPAKSYACSEFVDNSVPLCMLPDNTLDITPNMFASRCDEMSFDYVMGRPTLQYTFEWGTTDVTPAQVPGYLLFTVPMVFETVKQTIDSYTYNTDKVISATLQFGGVQNYILPMFELWRGDIDIKISIVKCGYQTGRLQFVYVPLTGNVPALEVRGDCYNRVLDLRESNEIALKIPFAVPTNYLSTHKDGNTFNMSGQSYGSLHCFIVNPLISPSTCAQQMDINVWYSFAPGVKLEAPCNRSAFPMAPVENTSAFLKDLDMEDSFELVKSQGGTATTDEAFSNLNKSVYDPLFVVPAKDSSKECIGESVINLRCLMRRFTLAYSTISNSSLSKARFGFKNAYQQDSSNTAPAYGAKGNFSYGNVDYLSWIYRFVRGGERYKVFCVNGNSGLFGAYVNKVNNTMVKDSTDEFFTPGYIDGKGMLNAVDPFTDSTVLASCPSFILNTNLNNFLEVMLPSYSNVDKQVVGAVCTSSFNIGENICLYPSISLLLPSVVSGDETSSSTNLIFTAGHDDSSFGWMIGPPPFCLAEDLFLKPTPLSADFSAVTSVTVNGPEVIIANVTFSAIPTAGNYKIVSAAIPGFETKYSGADGLGSFAGGKFVISTVAGVCNCTDLAPHTGIYDGPDTLTIVQNLGVVLFQVYYP